MIEVGLQKANGLPRGVDFHVGLLDCVLHLVPAVEDASGLHVLFHKHLDLFEKLGVYKLILVDDGQEPVDLAVEDSVVLESVHVLVSELVLFPGDPLQLFFPFSDINLHDADLAEKVFALEDLGLKSCLGIGCLASVPVQLAH